MTDTTPTAELAAEDVSIWLDDLSRDALTSGALAALIDGHNVTGVTTNPTIFATALRRGDAYAEQVASLASGGSSTEQAVLALVTDDVATACDLLRPQYDASGGRDGRVSIEVNPHLAYDTDATIDQARALHAAVDRDNVLIKIPATEAGLPAITATIAAGTSVNVTLIFSLDRYRQVIDAYLTGLEQAAANGHDLAGIRSVASFFVSRVDTDIDAQLDALGTDQAQALRGQAAIANARLAYTVFENAFGSDRFARLAYAGAHKQRPLWASTGVKDPAYSDTRYVTDLVAPDTVNTMPEKTLLAVADHGQIDGDQVRGTATQAQQVLDDLAAIGISYDEVVDRLEHDGVAKFIASWDDLVATVDTALAATR